MFQLNKTQQYIVDQAVEWYQNSSDTLFQFDGPAGTGKSVVLNSIVKKLKLKNRQILPMAYSGQAAIVMRTKGLINACTLHSGLFNIFLGPMVDSITGATIMNEKLNTPVLEWKFEPKFIDPFETKLIIVDEAWMVPKRFKKLIDNTKIKTIVAGDSSQLPPIKDEPAYLTSGKIYHLTELMRQSENSPLIYLANRARQGLPIENGMYSNMVCVLYDDELEDYLLEASDVILTCKNNTRDYYNNYYRHNILHYYEDYPHYGERLICRKNNWKINIDGISLANGLTGMVDREPDISTFDKKKLEIWFKPDVLGESFPISINYKFLNANHYEKEKIKSSKYTRNDLLEYAYASTVHLSQGSEYSTGIYIEDYMQNIQNALNYTAITRFKNGMVYVKHRPKFWHM